MPADVPNAALKLRVVEPVHTPAETPKNVRYVAEGLEVKVEAALISVTK